MIIIRELTEFVKLLFLPFAVILSTNNLDFGFFFGRIGGVKKKEEILCMKNYRQC